MADSKAKAEDKKKEEPTQVGPSPRSYAVQGNDLTGYIGVAPEYMTYADPSHKPYLTEKEAVLFTTMSDEDIAATREMPKNAKELGIQENERPAVAEDTGFQDGELMENYASQNSVTIDPVTGPSHPSIVSDDEEERQQKLAKGEEVDTTPDEVGPVVKGGEAAGQPQGGPQQTSRTRPPLGGPNTDPK